IQARSKQINLRSQGRRRQFPTRDFAVAVARPVTLAADKQHAIDGPVDGFYRDGRIGDCGEIVLTALRSLA
ncbi:hypothetical protein, partial [Roseateles sp. P5_E4]